LKRVLIADDYPPVREVIREYLGCYEDEFAVVAEAGDGREAVELAMELVPDVVLLDVRMPAIDGVQATRMLRARIPDAVIVTYTGFGFDHIEYLARRAGADAHLTKPFELNLLRREITMAMRARAQGDRVAGRACVGVAPSGSGCRGGEGRDPYL